MGGSPQTPVNLTRQLKTKINTKEEAPAHFKGHDGGSEDNVLEALKNCTALPAREFPFFFSKKNPWHPTNIKRSIPKINKVLKSLMKLPGVLTLN